MMRARRLQHREKPSVGACLARLDAVGSDAEVEFHTGADHVLAGCVHILEHGSAQHATIGGSGKELKWTETKAGELGGVSREAVSPACVTHASWCCHRCSDRLVLCLFSDDESVCDEFVPMQIEKFVMLKGMRHSLRLGQPNTTASKRQGDSIIASMRSNTYTRARCLSGAATRLLVALAGCANLFAREGGLGGECDELS